MRTRVAAAPKPRFPATALCVPRRRGRSHSRATPFAPEVARRRPKRTFTPPTGLPPVSIVRKRKQVRLPLRALRGLTDRRSTVGPWNTPAEVRQGRWFTNGSCDPSENVCTSEMVQPPGGQVGGVVVRLYTCPFT